MRLQQVEDTHGQRVFCYQCGVAMPLAGCWADLDGEPWKAYYCDKCKPSIYEQMKAAGVEVDHHESDLYVPVNETTKAIVDGYKFKNNVTQFRSQIDGTNWYDIPFAYQPFWDKRGMR